MLLISSIDSFRLPNHTLSRVSSSVGSSLRLEAECSFVIPEERHLVVLRKKEDTRIKALTA